MGIFTNKNGELFDHLRATLYDRLALICVVKEANHELTKKQSKRCTE